MGTTIYYFSATGNSLDIARRIAGRLDGCTLQSMTKPAPETSVGGSGESVGFIFPVFYMGLPRLVRNFMENINVAEGTYCFTVISTGGSAANAAGMLEEILAKKGVNLSFAAEITMPGSCIAMHQTPDSEAIRKILAAAETAAEQAAEAIAGHERRPVVQRAAWLCRISNRCYLYQGIAEWDKQFTATEKCTGCGTCAGVCPVGNIKLADGHPVWQHRCEHCLACIHWCPREAIEYGKKTVGRRRYRNPNTDAGDIMAAK